MELVDGGKAAETVRTYRKLLERLHDEGYSADYTGVYGRILDPTPIKGITLTKTITAVQWAADRMRHLGVRRIPEEKADYLRMLINGRERLRQTEEEAETYSRRGAIDMSKLDELTWFLHTKKKRSAGEIRAIIACWATALRTSQMSTVCAGDFHLNEAGTGYILTLAKIHDPKLWATRGGRPRIEVRDVHEIGTPIIAEAIAGKAKDTPLWPQWKPRVVCRLIQECAVHCGWPPELKWNGAHCLRHGVAAEVFFRKGIGAAAKVTGHVGYCVKRYIESNERRLAKLFKRWRRPRAQAGEDSEDEE